MKINKGIQTKENTTLHGNCTFFKVIVLSFFWMTLFIVRHHFIKYTVIQETFHVMSREAGHMIHKQNF